LYDNHKFINVICAFYNLKIDTATLPVNQNWIWDLWNYVIFNLTTKSTYCLWNRNEPGPCHVWSKVADNHGICFIFFFSLMHVHVHTRTVSVHSWSDNNEFCLLCCGHFLPADEAVTCIQTAVSLPKKAFVVPFRVNVV